MLLNELSSSDQAKKQIMLQYKLKRQEQNNQPLSQVKKRIEQNAAASEMKAQP